MPGPMIQVWTDGSCYPNPGPGGWAAILQAPGGQEKVIVGSVVHTTNNVMELAAVVAALTEIRRPSRVVVRSDSQYVCSAFTKGHLEAWQAGGWLTKGRTPQPIKNRQWWEQLAKVVAWHEEVSFRHLRGHQGDPMNERCDELAGLARKAVQLELPEAA